MVWSILPEEPLIQWAKGPAVGVVTGRCVAAIFGGEYGGAFVVRREIISHALTTRLPGVIGGHLLLRKGKRQGIWTQQGDNMSKLPDSSPKGFLVRILQELLSADNLFSESLLAVIQRLQEQKYLFVLGVVVLVTFALMIVYVINPETPIPFYVALAAILILALSALGMTVLSSKRVIPRKIQSGGSREDKEGKVIPISEDCELLKRQLKAARETLNELEVQAAAIPETERTATFSRNLRKQREMVRDLEQRLEECLQGSMRNDQ